jgi:protein SCO1
VRGARALALLASLLGAFAVPALGHEAAPLPALDFEPPAPGTYTLHRIMAAPDGEVLGLDGRAQRLSRFTRGRITLLGFIYTTCADPDGCPLASRVFDIVGEELAATPALRDKVRLVTLSFDPARDSPAAMRAYARARVRASGEGVPWDVLTTRSARALKPLLEGFGQDVRYTVDRSSGRPRRELSHVLKVFLIDPAGFVREIYTSTFLHPQTVRNDIETLLLEEASPPSPGFLPAECEARSGELRGAVVASRIDKLGTRYVLTVSCKGTHSLYLARAQPFDVATMLGQPLCVRYRYVDEPRAPMPCLRPPCPDRERVLELAEVRPAASPEATCGDP